MIRVSAFPTVEWLHSRAADRPAIPGRSRSRPSGASRDDARREPVTRRTFVESIVRRLRAWTVPDVSVHVDEWVATPEGEQPVDIVVRGGDRCIGILVDRRYDRDTETLDALRLVYGHFDTLYRIGRHEPESAVNDVLCAIVSEKRTWFTSHGRFNAMRGATAGVRRGGPGWISDAERPAVRRMRLSRANEWVRAFERALAPNPGGQAVSRKDAAADHPAGHPEQD